MEELGKSSFLLHEIQAGEERAFDFIFRKYYKSLCAQANAYVNDLDIAQSLVQDCFVKLWESREKMAAINNLNSYLTFMVRNRSIDYLRSLKNKIIINLDGAKEKFADDEYEMILTREFEEKLVEALNRLPERCREAFEYSRFDNLSYKEIAEKMEISVKAVEAHLSKALKLLRKDMKDYLPILLFIGKMMKF